MLVAQQCRPRSRCRANVAIHGSFGGHTAGWAKNAKGMFLFLHGAEDPNYPVEFSHVIDDVNAGAKMHRLAGAKIPQ